MALLRRRDTGKGDYVDVAMLDSLLAWAPNVTGKIFATGEPHTPKHERSWGGSAMFQLYECADGQWIALGGSEVKFARNLLAALGRLDLLPYAELQPGPGQYPLRDFYRETFRARTRAEWEAWFEGKDVCFAPVRNLKEGFEDPAVAARGMLAFDPEGNEVVGTPITFRDEPGVIDPSVPALDADRGSIQEKGWG